MKKTIVEINSCNYGSTGNVMLQIAETVRKEKYSVFTCCPASRSNSQRKIENQIFIGNRFTRNIHLKLSQYTGLNGCFSYFSTQMFLRKLRKLQPDLLHLHNLHNAYINLPLLFKYIKKNNIPVVWTLHDCWAFTGQCPHFTMVKCGRWKTGCHDCPSYREYPESKVDQTRIMWKLKKKWFTGVENMTIVTPSKWLANLVKESYLGEYPVKVINNGIDLSVFRPVDNNFRQRYAIGEKKIILGVAFDWGVRKGLDVFVELAEKLDEEKLQIVLVGTDETVDKTLPKNIISIHRTHNQKELAEIYTAADVFVNPTREDNYPTVNMEAIACGTPVITFNTGGSPESIGEYTGLVTKCNDASELKQTLNQFFESKIGFKEKCVELSTDFDKNNKYEEYMELFKSIIQQNK